MGLLKDQRARISGTIRQEYSGLFVVEGVVGGVGVALAGWGRGLPMMGVVTLPIWKTPTWTTLPSTVLI